MNGRKAKELRVISAQVLTGSQHPFVRAARAAMEKYDAKLDMLHARVGQGECVIRTPPKSGEGEPNQGAVNPYRKFKKWIRRVYLPAISGKA